MRWNNFYIAVLLLVSLFLYTFYRGEQVLINVIWDKIGWHTRLNLASQLRWLLPLPAWMVYNLPEALWIFCLTLAAGRLVFRLGRLVLPLSLIPPAIIIGLEVFQALGITNGTFDLWDIIIPMLFWIIAHCYTHYIRPSRLSFVSFRAPTYRFFALWVVVLLAHHVG